MAPISSLYAITQRLNLTPTAELPQMASFLASSIYNCSDILSRPQGPGSARGGDDDAVLVHKLKTRLSSLLQDRNSHAQWTAVILIKAAVEAGGWEILNGCASWLRSIVSILGRPNIQAIRRPCFVTVTRILILVQRYPTLVREIATPILPTFLSACVDQASRNLALEKQGAPIVPDNYLTDIFQSISELIPRYPTLFRPFRIKIWAAATHCLGLVPVTHSAHIAACTALVHLHECAPKNAVEAEWVNLSRLTISTIHDTANQLFRSVHEDWEHPDQERREAPRVQDYTGEVCGDFKDELKLPGWRGINQGTDRLESLIGLLRSMLNVSTSIPVSLSVGQIVNVTSRLTSLIVPSSDKPLHNQVRINEEAPRLEREELFAALPRLHIQCLQLLTDLLRTFGTGVISVAQSLFEQMLWIFNAEKDIPDVRAECYTFLSDSISSLSSTWSRSDVGQIVKLAEYCCCDILQEKNMPRDNCQQGHNIHDRHDVSTATNADTFLAEPLQTASKQQLKQSRVEYAAALLLPRLLTYIPSSSMPLSLRAELDRTAILSQHKEAMLASVLNPMPTVRGKVSLPSIMPFFARECGGDLLAEGVLRPRMPAIPNFEDQENDLLETGNEYFAQAGNRKDQEAIHVENTENRTDVTASGREDIERSQPSAPAQLASSSENVSGGLFAADPASPQNRLMGVSSDHAGFKRDWTSANVPTKYGDVTSTLASGDQTAKKLRVSEEGNPRPPLTEHSRDSSMPNSSAHRAPDIEKSNIEIKNAFTSPAAELADEALQSPSIKRVTQNNSDDGDSDFDIPTIDPTIDSEDDDDDDDEKEDGGDSDQN